jgi:hypothetical protein
MHVIEADADNPVFRHGRSALLSFPAAVRATGLEQ